MNPHQEIETYQRSPDSAGQTRLLYVEDEATIRRMCGLILERAGYSVVTARDGLEGWAMLANARFDLVVTDIDMPRINGVELLAMVRAKGWRIPFIFASGSLEHFPEAGNPGLHLGATLSKPFGPEELVATVRQVLGSVSGDGREPHVPWQAVPESSSSRSNPSETLAR